MKLENDKVFDGSSMEMMFCGNVWSELKDKVQGHVFCKIVDDTLQISISKGNFKWRYDIEDISSKIVKGEMTSHNVVTIIFTEYRKSIIKRTNNYYFKQERKGFVGNVREISKTRRKGFHKEYFDFNKPNDRGLVTIGELCPGDIYNPKGCEDYVDNIVDAIQKNYVESLTDVKES